MNVSGAITTSRDNPSQRITGQPGNLLDDLPQALRKAKNGEQLHNLTWALNVDHSEDYVKAVYETLSKAEKNGLSFAQRRDNVVNALNSIAKELSTGKPFRGLPTK